MADILGVHFGPARMAAVRVGSDGAMAPLALGEDDPTAPVAVGPGPDGAMLVGQAAADRSSEPVTDPVEQAAAGRLEPLSALVAHLVGRAAAAAGSPPERLALVIPDEFDGDARDRVVSAAIYGGVADVVAVPLTVARARQPGSEDDNRPAEVLIAAGAALVVHSMPPPFVTREEVDGHPPTTVPPMGPEVDEPTVPVSVFDDDEEVPPPVRPVPHDAASTSSAPRTTTMPTVSAAQPRGPAQSRERRVPVWLIFAFAVVLVAILATATLLALAAGDESDNPVASDSTTSIPTTTTTEPADTTSSSTSTTSSSTSTSTSSTSTSSTSSTTTAPLPVGSPGPVTLVETGLQLDSGSVLQFGQDGERIVEEIAQVLGEPDDETDFDEQEFCFGDRHKFVTWGQLEIVLEEIDQGDTRFVEWFADGSSDPVGLVTVDGLGVGATVGFLQVNYGSSLQLEAAFEGSEEGLFAIVNSGSGGVLVGVTDGLGPDDAVQQLWAGDACQRTAL